MNGFFPWEFVFWSLTSVLSTWNSTAKMRLSTLVESRHPATPDGSYSEHWLLFRANFFRIRSQTLQIFVLIFCNSVFSTTFDRFLSVRVGVTKQVTFLKNEDKTGQVSVCVNEDIVKLVFLSIYDIAFAHCVSLGWNKLPNQRFWGRDWGVAFMILWFLTHQLHTANYKGQSQCIKSGLYFSTKF